MCTFLNNLFKKKKYFYILYYVNNNHKDIIVISDSKNKLVLYYTNYLSIAFPLLKYFDQKKCTNKYYIIEEIKIL